MVSRRQVLGTLGVVGAGAGIGALAWWRRGSETGLPAGSCPAVSGGRIRWIVPHSAGGGYDTESRLIEPFLERRLGTEIVIENLAGAGGVTGARAIASARADGRTWGIVGVPGLLIAPLTGSTGAPDPAAFTILGRLSRSWHVWAVGRDSRIRTIDDAVAAARTRPLIFAVSEAASVNVLAISVTGALLGTPIDMVAGFPGSQGASLAAVRGDVDLVCFNFEAIRDLLAAGDLRPLLQISDRPISADASLAGVPLLGGADGYVARGALDRGNPPGHDHAMAKALIEVVGAGRIVVAPRGLDPELTRCLAAVLHDTLASSDVTASARSWDIATADRARADVLSAVRGLPILHAPLLAAMRAIRG